MKKLNFNPARRGFIKVGAATALLVIGIKPSETKAMPGYPWPGEPPREPVEGVECGNDVRVGDTVQIRKLGKYDSINPLPLFEYEYYTVVGFNEDGTPKLELQKS